MKASGLAVLVLWLTGCVGTRPGPRLTIEQATALAVQLANGKAATLYQCQPFSDGRPAQFAARHWVWTDRRGVGHQDIQATVELAADGSTNRVDLKVLDSINRIM